MAILVSCQNRVHISDDQAGFRMMVQDEPIFINGMNWDYFPIGHSYSYSLWEQEEEYIKSILDYEMSMLQDLGVNVIRQYDGVPSKWISFIYDHYDIYTIINHSFGRYGVDINGDWHEKTDYEDINTRTQLLKEIDAFANRYKDTRGMLFYLLGNENNYGLFWKGSETESVPTEISPLQLKQAEGLYSLFNQASLTIKSIDKNHPVAMCNGDLLFIDLIAELCKDVDIFGANIYRGLSFNDAFDVVKEKLDKPFIITEFGADAFHAIQGVEDQKDQSKYIVANWKEIYSNAAGHGDAENSIGGLTFQFSDGWWKFDQSKNLNVHDTIASWHNGGYEADYIEGRKNMNEEWFGICAKERKTESGDYILKPRIAFHALKGVHQYKPLNSDRDVQYLEKHFEMIKSKNFIEGTEIVDQ